MRRLAGLIALLALASPGPAAAADHPVSVANFAFSPTQVNIAPGDSVVWTWSGPDTNHSVTRTSSQEPFDSDPGNPFPSHPAGHTFSRRFDNEGTYSYYCKVHTYMTGRVVVGSGVGGDNTGSGQQQGTDVTPPRIAAASVSPSRFCGRRRGSCRRDGARLRVTLSEAASVRAVVRKRGARRASRTLTRAARAGGNSFAFGTGLAPGAYTVRLTATDGANLVSTPVTRSFSVRRPR